jgi:hypothetical protein
MADFLVTKMPDDTVRGVTTNVMASGITYQGKRLLGDAGAAATGKGDWFRVSGRLKAFFLYPTTKLAATDISAAIVEVHGAMEMPATTPELASFKILGTLNNAARSFETYGPWRYVRAVVTTPAAGTVPVQVGLCVEG